MKIPLLLQATEYLDSQPYSSDNKSSIGDTLPHTV